MFEVVYAVLDWYDGPRRGITDCKGHAHLFESEWRDREDVEADTFLLTPIDSETFALVLEDWTIWRRWETAFHKGMAARESHPTLPEEQQRAPRAPTSPRWPFVGRSDPGSSPDS